MRLNSLSKIGRKRWQIETCLGSNTFEQFRVEFNELATDVGDIAGITGASGIIASATDVVSQLRY